MSQKTIPFDAGDFRLLDRAVVEAICKCHNRVLFMKGIFGWGGFKSCAVYYDRPARNAGKISWNYWELFNFALDGIFNSTTIPLRIWTPFGLLIALLSVFFAIFLIIKTLIFGISATGYASILVFVLFLGSIQLISLGILGEYIGRIFNESKRRPVYIVWEIIGKEEDEK
jgi:glycosyltransferase involved in cell wall biosynthesis